jgi:hypothetical protein
MNYGHYFKSEHETSPSTVLYYKSGPVWRMLREAVTVTSIKVVPGPSCPMMWISAISSGHCAELHGTRRTWYEVDWWYTGQALTTQTHSWSRCQASVLSSVIPIFWTWHPACHLRIHSRHLVSSIQKLGTSSSITSLLVPRTTQAWSSETLSKQSQFPFRQLWSVFSLQARELPSISFPHIPTLLVLFPFPILLHATNCLVTMQSHHYPVALSSFPRVLWLLLLLRPPLPHLLCSPLHNFIDIIVPPSITFCNTLDMF